MLGVPVDQVQISSFAGAVKDEVAILLDIPRSELDTQEGKQRRIPTAEGQIVTVRDMLIHHAESEKIRTGDPAIWAHRIFPKPTTTHWILSDWRFPAEYAHLRQRFPSAHTHTVRIHRPSVQSLATYTEHELDGVPSSCVLENVGSLLYLRKQVHDMLTSMFASS